MKFTVDIDLDWIGEDNSIDDVVKSQIISSVENKVIGTLKEKILKSAEEKIESQMSALANSAVMEKISEIMSQERTITDSYGRVKEANITLEQMLITAIDSAISTKTLTESGKHADSYNAKFSAFEYFATKQIPELINKRIAALSEKTQKDIEALVTEKIKTQVADKLTAMIMDNSTALSLKK